MYHRWYWLVFSDAQWWWMPQRRHQRLTGARGRGSLLVLFWLLCWYSSSLSSSLCRFSSSLSSSLCWYSSSLSSSLCWFSSYLSSSLCLYSSSLSSSVPSLVSYCPPSWSCPLRSEDEGCQYQSNCLTMVAEEGWAYVLCVVVVVGVVLVPLHLDPGLILDLLIIQQLLLFSNNSFIPSFHPSIPGKLMRCTKSFLIRRKR